MCLLFETIRIEDGQPCNLEWHRLRIERSLRELYGIACCFNLAENIIIPGYARNGVFKCRLYYERNIGKVEFEHYRLPVIRSLKVIETGDFDYSYKHTNRSAIENYFSLRGVCDDILMTRNGMFTDTSFCNVIFDDGKRWVTPANPLLRGTRRQKLIADGTIAEQEVGVEDLGKFKKLILTNAMIAPGDIKPIPVRRIVF